jgi:hypothetical protein
LRHARLALVYGWSTEGFDTLNLKQAKTVLAELASLVVAREPTRKTDDFR